MVGSFTRESPEAPFSNLQRYEIASFTEMPNDYYCFIIMAVSRITSVTDDVLNCIK